MVPLPVLFRGCGEEIHLSSSVCVVLNLLGLSSTSGPHSPLQCSPRTKPLHASSQTAIQAFTGEKHNRLERRNSQQLLKWYHNKKKGKHSQVKHGKTTSHKWLWTHSTQSSMQSLEELHRRQWERNGSSICACGEKDTVKTHNCECHYDHDSTMK